LRSGTSGLTRAGYLGSVDGVECAHAAPLTQDRGVSELKPTGRSTGRLSQTVGDMGRSLLVVLAVVAVIVLFAWRPQPEAIRVVDVQPYVSVVGAQAEFAATRLPESVPGFRPTSVRWEPTADSGGQPVWFVGYVTPSERYLQISQSSATGPDFLREQTAGGAQTGTVDIDGTTWERYETAERRSLVLQTDATTVVSGTETWDTLIAVAESLVPVSQ
jgi:hypothetical protein